MRAPRLYRKATGNRVSWEIYSWRAWFVTVNIGSLEIQFNKWRRRLK